MKFNFTLENLPPREKVTVSVSAHTEETFYFCTHLLMIYNANFRDLVLVCILVIQDPITSIESYMLYIVI